MQSSKTVTVNVDEQGLCIVRACSESRLLLWGDIEEIATLLNSGLSTGSFSLAIRTRSNELFVIDDTVTQWDELCAELPRDLVGARSY